MASSQDGSPLGSALIDHLVESQTDPGPGTEADQGGATAVIPGPGDADTPPVSGPGDVAGPGGAPPVNPAPIDHPSLQIIQSSKISRS